MSGDRAVVDEVALNAAVSRLQTVMNTINGTEFSANERLSRNRRTLSKDEVTRNCLWVFQLFSALRIIVIRSTFQRKHEYFVGTCLMTSLILVNAAYRERDPQYCSQPWPCLIRN